MGLALADRVVPGVVAQGDLVGKTPFGSGTGARGIFPFRLGRQAVVLLRFVAELAYIGLRVMPGHVLHRQVAGFAKARVFAHQGPPLLLRDLMLAHGKSRNLDLVLGHFIGLSPRRFGGTGCIHTCWRAHPKTAAWHHHHVWTLRAISHGRSGGHRWLRGLLVGLRNSALGGWGLRQSGLRQ